ncbi:hypothetical protein J6590_066279 [Homalodisca vitripennis]|nr:hypothetical protein J6590_066279 [Homalodisca vitripennis]
MFSEYRCCNERVSTKPPIINVCNQVPAGLLLIPTGSHSSLQIVPGPSSWNQNYCNLPGNFPITDLVSRPWPAPRVSIQIVPLPEHGGSLSPLAPVFANHDSEPPRFPCPRIKYNFQYLSRNTDLPRYPCTGLPRPTRAFRWNPCLESDAVTDLTPGIWSHVRLKRFKNCRSRKNSKRNLARWSKFSTHKPAMVGRLQFTFVLESDITDLTPGIWSHVRLERPKNRRRRRSSK